MIEIDLALLFCVMLNDKGDRQPKIQQFCLNEWPETFHIVCLREIDRKLRQRTIGQCGTSVLTKEILNDATNVLIHIFIAEIVRNDVVRDILEYPVPDSFRESVPDDHITEELTLKVGRARRIDDTDQVGTVVVQVIDGFSNFLQFSVECLTIGMVSLVRENCKMGQGSKFAQATVCHRGPRLIFLFRGSKEVSDIGFSDCL